MVITVKSQLGLMIRDRSVKMDFAKLSYKYYSSELNTIKTLLDKVQNDTLSEKESEEYLYTIEHNVNTPSSQKCLDELNSKFDDKCGLVLMADNCKNYYICNSVYQASALIKISSGFTTTIFKNIENGSYTYLMGRNVMTRFIFKDGCIIGMYYDSAKNICMDWGCTTNSGEYYYDDKYLNEFSLIMRLMTFIELGDLTIKMVTSNTSNKKSQEDPDRVFNGTKNTVYVVDSTWNQILVRTDGFAVRGHYRLQPCGVNMVDRKLIWINAFEKHGYVRKPKGNIEPTASVKDGN